MQLSFLPVAFPQTDSRSFGGLARTIADSRSFGGPCGTPGLTRSFGGPGAAQSRARRSHCAVHQTEKHRAVVGMDGECSSPMSRKPVTQSPIEQIKAAQSGTSQRGKSELHKWMWDHFDQLDKDRHGRPDWVAATEQYSQLGLTDASGEPLKPRNVRRVWERVVRDRLAIAKAPQPATSTFAG